jgi:hypothetical protein
VNGQDVRPEALEERRKRLARLLSRSNKTMRDGIQLSEAITGDGGRIFRHACELGFEGIVSKRTGSRYVSGRTRHGCSLLGIADKLDSAHLSTAAPEERRAVAVQLDRGAGQLAGLADVLRFQAGPSPPQTRRRGVLGSWASDTLATVVGSVSIAAIAAGTEKLPLVGPTLASLIQGEVPSNSDS